MRINEKHSALSLSAGLVPCGSPILNTCQALKVKTTRKCEVSNNENLFHNSLSAAI